MKEKAAQSSGESSKKMPRGKPFEKGQSGNPGGRKKMPEEVKQMFVEASTDAAALLVSFMKDETKGDKLRKECAETVLDRAFGKPTQSIDGKMAVAAVEITDEDALEALEVLGFVRK